MKDKRNVNSLTEAAKVKLVEKMNKQVIKIVMTLALLLACSMSSFAQFSGGNGTEGNPYIITTAAQLAQLATYVNAGNTDYNDKYYKLGNDIDLSAYQNGTGWTPIGTWNYRFRGVFDGNNKKITRLTINNPSLKELGLFGCIGDATIKNLGVENVNIKGGDYVGSIAGYGDEIGKITRCYSSGEVSGSNNIGGIVGSIQVSIVIDGAPIENCYFTGKVSGKDQIGGICGNLYKSCAKNCYSIGEVSGEGCVGGIVGYLGGGYGYIMNCVALNSSVKGTITNVGRIVGGYNSILSKNAAWDGIINVYGNTNWENKGDYKIDGEDITLQSIKSDGTLGGRFTSADGWTTQNGKLPGLFGKPIEMPAHLGGVGIAENETSQFSLFPNPTNDNFVVECENFSTIKLYDMLGQEVLIQTANGKSEINISHLPQGVYSVRVFSESRVVWNGKIVKQ